MAGKKVLQRFGGKADLDDHFGDFGNKIKLPENTRIMALYLLGIEIWRTCERILCDDTPYRKSYKYRGPQTSESISLSDLSEVQVAEGASVQRLQSFRTDRVHIDDGKSHRNAWSPISRPSPGRECSIHKVGGEPTCNKNHAAQERFSVNVWAGIVADCNVLA
ncbi:hypothetical protein AVEN_130695-1 [Araneus ventricosus]|uniref:Uncharacterized protein n=1 Tax=Araneus ventricosus TaxID=182803 RepID=A0A4Y2S532_ARAVE|nr:hypothetical protein AVEN_130695-1 [Araneus ventricosus]